MRCDYCPCEATARIPAALSEVCCTHAIEFWTGLLAYAKEQRGPVDSDGCPGAVGPMWAAGRRSWLRLRQPALSRPWPSGGHVMRPDGP